MKNFLCFNLNGRHYELWMNCVGKEVLLCDGEEVLRRWNFCSVNKGVIPFVCPDAGDLKLSYKMGADGMSLVYHITDGMAEICHGQVSIEEHMPKWVCSLNKMALETEGEAEVEAEQETVRKTSWSGVFARLNALKVGLFVVALFVLVWMSDLETAIAITLVLLIHEYGHVWAMRQSNIKVIGVYMIPFFGAVALGGKCKTFWQIFKMYMGGPALGAACAVLTWLFWLQTGHSFFAKMTTVGVFLNLFNLLPIYPLDGGQIVRAMAMSLRSRIIIYALLAANLIFISFHLYIGLTEFEYMYIVLGVFFLIGFSVLWFEKKLDEPTHQPMGKGATALASISYIMLIVFLIWISAPMSATGVPAINLQKLLF